MNQYVQPIQCASSVPGIRGGMGGSSGEFHLEVDDGLGALDIGFVLMIAALSWLLVAKEFWMLILFACMFGYAYGGLVSAQSPIVADLFGIRSHGEILGVIVFIITIGAAAGPVIAGGVFDATQSYYPAFLVCIGFGIIGVILTLFLKPLVRGGDR